MNDKLPAATREFYLRAMRLLDEAGIEFLVGGAYAFERYTGIARHTKEGYAFQQRAAEAGFKQAVLERDTPFGDAGPSTFKG